MTVPYAGRLLPAVAGRLIVAAPDGRLLVRGSDDRVDAIAPDRIGGVTAVAISADGGIYFATANAIGRLVPAVP
jgi:hypothetical protein